MIGNIRRLVPLFLLLLSALAGHAAIGVDLQMPLGNPAGAAGDPADPRRFLLRRAQYALEYNDATRAANWVSWSLGLADLGASGRGDFAVDPALPAGLTRVQPEDYSGSGFDRGHLCPSGDRTVTVADNQATFYMTNILPQTPDHNQGVWASFESYCRSLAGLGNEILVVTGPSGFGAERLPGGIAVPSHVWKIAVVGPSGPGSAVSRITNATRVIAIKVPNIPGIRTNPWQQYLTSVARLQTDTGYTFFSELPPETAAALRAKVDEPSTAGAPRITAQPASQAAALNLGSGAGSLFWDFSAATATGGLPRDIGGGLVSQQNNNGTTALLTNASVSSGYPGASGGNNAGAAARTGPLNRAAGSGSAAFEFTLEVPAGRRLVVSSLSFGSRSTPTGPRAW
ncbi:MAG: DNA/RNA non-specific endonuclease [Opitutaceae bacterium]